MTPAKQRDIKCKHHKPKENSQTCIIIQYLKKTKYLQKHRLSHIHTLHQHLFTDDQQAKNKLERNAEVLVLSFHVPLTQAA